MATPFESLKAALADRYTLERELGAGGMATVFLAHDPRHNRKVAIKVMHPDLADRIGPERFLKEIQTTANLQHPHILSLFDSGRVEGTVFFVMPYVQGETLRRRLERETQLPIADAIRIATEIADGLDYAHRQGVIHRDIKPDNVLFHDGRALVADFGIALAVGQSGGERMTGTGLTLGTPAYMSPEQAAGERHLDGRSDIYSLACVLYEMIAGEPPFTGPTPQAVIAKRFGGPPPRLHVIRDGVPEALEGAIDRALAKAPADRFSTALQFSAALSAPAEVFAAALTGGAVSPRRPRGRRALAPWALAGVLLLAVGWVGLRNGKSAPPAIAGPARFTIDLDSGVLPTYTPIVRLSADGQDLFVSAMVNRREEVMHRRLDRMRMEVISGAGMGEQGTENSRPFVSPDGRWVAYHKQGKLWKVLVEGGPPVDLAVSDWAGGNWGRNGKLVYGRSYNTGLWIVSEGGGDERMLTTPDTAEHELGHWWPQILPDGDHVIFTAYRTPINEATIEVVSMKSGQRKVLLKGGVFGYYVPTGHLLYAVGETIRAAPFDLKRLAVTGTGLPVVDSVAMNLTDGAAAFAVSENGTLAYMPMTSYGMETQVVLVDRRGLDSPALPARDRYGNPRLSPDGSRVAVDIRSPSSAGDVWVFQVGRTGGVRLTSEGGREFGAEWTADGKELIYSSERPFFDLYRRVADASRPAQMLQSGTYDRYLGSVSHDGRLLVFTLSTSGGTQLWTVNLQGKPEAKRFFSNGFNLAHAAFSPDGRWVAYDSDESGHVEVFVQSFPDPNQKRWKVSSAEGSEPMWTREGRELVYRKGDSVMAVSVDMQNGRSDAPSLLFAGPYPDNPGWTRPRSYDVSPDGERFLMIKLPSGQPPPKISVVLNWFDELRAKVPSGK